MAERHDTDEIIETLTRLLESRRNAAPESSYVASLYHGGLNRILEKLGEEATETLIAAKDAGAPGADTRSAEPDAALLGEVADLWFHSMVMLVYLGQRPAWVLDELRRRLGVSGLDEKASRPRPRS